MYVRHLSVADFRSWVAAEVEFEPGPAVLLGANGQGKTNLVEALGYVATLGSHRVATDAPLIRAGAERAVVRCATVADARELRVELELLPGKANRARLNGSPVSRPREILGALAGHLPHQRAGPLAKRKQIQLSGLFGRPATGCMPLQRLAGRCTCRKGIA